MIRNRYKFLMMAMSEDFDDRAKIESRRLFDIYTDINESTKRVAKILSFLALMIGTNGTAVLFTLIILIL